jgi:hypothetical protein
MYNYSLKLSYKQSDRDDTYRKELLKAMNLEKYDTDAISNIFKTEILPLLEPHFINVFSMIKNNFQLPVLLDNEMCLTLLFAWEYFDLLHLCLGEIKENKVENSITNLIAELESRK